MTEPDPTIVDSFDLPKPVIEATPKITLEGLQMRDKVRGLYQGSGVNELFWEMDKVPAGVGIMCFDTEAEAVQHFAYMKTLDPELRWDTITLEKFDLDLNCRMIAARYPKPAPVIKKKVEALPTLPESLTAKLARFKPPAANLVNPPPQV